MKRYTTYSLLFLLVLMLCSSFSHSANADPEIEALLDLISDLESERDSLVQSKAEAEAERDAARVSLNGIWDALSQTDMFLSSAWDAYAAAQNDVERAYWASVIEDLENYRQVLIYQYNSVVYTVSRLNAEIETLNKAIAKIQSRLDQAYARLAELQN